MLPKLCFELLDALSLLVASGLQLLFLLIELVVLFGLLGDGLLELVVLGLFVLDCVFQ